MRAKQFSYQETAGGLLAAGCSKRMGNMNKLLCEIDGVPMVRKIAIEMIRSDLKHCFVVLGYQAKKVAVALEGLPLKLIENKRWYEGQGTSISLLAKTVSVFNSNVLIMLADLPGIKKSHLNLLLEDHGSATDPEYTITVPEFNKQRGNPLIWGRYFLPELKKLSGDLGGRSLLEKYKRKVNKIDFAADCIVRDVDTKAELETWIKKKTIKQLNN